MKSVASGGYLPNNKNLKFNTGEISAYYESKFPTLVSNLHEFFNESDRFGVCGIVAFCLLNAYLKQNYDINDSITNTNFLEMKRSFDRFNQNPIEHVRPVSKFLADNGIVLEAKKVKAYGEVADVIRNLGSNQGILLSIIAHFPKYNGAYTHWLALLNVSKENAIVAGDLSPLKIYKNFLSYIDTQILLNLCKEVLTTKATTSNTKQLGQDPESKKWRNGDRFINNLAIVTFQAQCQGISSL